MHGAVAPLYGKLEDHKPDLPNNSFASSDPKQVTAKKKKKKDRERIYHSEEVKMLARPRKLKKVDDNPGVQDSWADLAGDG